jgi:hypothetical protein
MMIESNINESMWHSYFKTRKKQEFSTEKPMYTSATEYTIWFTLEPYFRRI